MKKIKKLSNYYGRIDGEKKYSNMCRLFMRKVWERSMKKKTAKIKIIEINLTFEKIYCTTLIQINMPRLYLVHHCVVNRFTTLHSVYRIVQYHIIIYTVVYNTYCVIW